MVFDDFLSHRRHEIDRQSENMHEGITRDTEDFLPPRQGYTNTSPGGTQSHTCTESPPTSSTEHAKGANGGENGLLQKARPKVVHNVKHRYIIFLKELLRQKKMRLPLYPSILPQQKRLKRIYSRSLMKTTDHCVASSI